MNKTKTHRTTSDAGVKFLGVEIYTEYTRIQASKLQAFKAKIKSMTGRNVGWNLHEVVKQLNPILRGFTHYFKIANCSRAFKEVMGWLRRRLRCIQLKQWKTPNKLHRRLRQLGYKGRFPRMRMPSWRNAASPQASYAMPNKWFHHELGLINMSETQTGVLVPDPLG